MYVHYIQNIIISPCSQYKRMRYFAFLCYTQSLKAVCFTHWAHLHGATNFSLKWLILYLNFIMFTVEKVVHNNPCCFKYSYGTSSHHKLNAHNPLSQDPLGGEPRPWHLAEEIPVCSQTDCRRQIALTLVWTQWHTDGNDQSTVFMHSFIYSTSIYWAVTMYHLPF